ncbi:MAG: hypothetical protein K8R69_08080 [Deltaproteobacteria bacterium]|nr:hypothetical protein [Deltaproteobacteria bacterium]
MTSPIMKVINAAADTMAVMIMESPVSKGIVTDGQWIAKQVEGPVNAAADTMAVMIMESPVNKGIVTAGKCVAKQLEGPVKLIVESPVNKGIVTAGQWVVKQAESPGKVAQPESGAVSEALNDYRASTAGDLCGVERSSTPADSFGSSLADFNSGLKKAKAILEDASLPPEQRVQEAKEHVEKARDAYEQLSAENLCSPNMGVRIVDAEAAIQEFSRAHGLTDNNK